MLHQDPVLDRFAQELVTTQFLVYAPLTQVQALQWLAFLQALIPPLENLKTQELLPDLSLPIFSPDSCPVPNNPSLVDKWTSLADPVLILGITPSQWPLFCSYLLAQIHLCLTRDRPLYLQEPSLCLSNLLEDLVLACQSAQISPPGPAPLLSGSPSHFFPLPRHVAPLPQHPPRSPQGSIYSDIQESLFEDERNTEESEPSPLPLVRPFSQNSSPFLSQPCSPTRSPQSSSQQERLLADLQETILALTPQNLESSHSLQQPLSPTPIRQESYHYPHLVPLSLGYQALRTHAPSADLLAIEAQLFHSLDPRLSAPLWSNICESLRKEALKIQLKAKTSATVDRLSTYKHPWLYQASLQFVHVDWSEEKQAFEQQMWFLDDSPAPLIRQLFASDSFSQCMLSGHVSWIDTSILFSLTDPQGPLAIEWLSLWIQCDSECQSSLPSRASCQLILHQMAQILCTTPVPSLLYALSAYVREKTPEPSVSSPSYSIRPFGSPLADSARHASEDLLSSTLWLEEMLDEGLSTDLDPHWLLRFLSSAISLSPDRLLERLPQIILTLLSLHQQSDERPLRSAIFQVLDSITQTPPLDQALKESLSLIFPPCAHRDLPLLLPLIPYARLYASKRKPHSSSRAMTTDCPEPTPLLDWIAHLLEDYPLTPFQMIQSLVVAGSCDPEVGEELYLLLFHSFSNFKFEVFLEFCKVYSPSNLPPISLLRYVALKPTPHSFPILQRLLLAFENPVPLQDSPYPLLLVQATLQRPRNPSSPLFLASQNFMLHFAQSFPLSLQLEPAQDSHSLPRSFLLALATRGSFDLWSVLPLETLYAASAPDLTLVFQALAPIPEASDFLHHLMNLSPHGNLVALDFINPLLHAQAWALLANLRSSSVRYQNHAQPLLHRLLWQTLQILLSAAPLPSQDIEHIEQILFFRLSDLYDWEPLYSPSPLLPSSQISSSLAPATPLPSLASWIVYHREKLPDLYQQLRIHAGKTSIFCDPAFTTQAQNNPLFFQQLCSLSRVEYSLWWEYLHSPKDWPLRSSYKKLFLQKTLAKELTLIYHAALDFEGQRDSMSDDPFALKPKSSHSTVQERAPTFHSRRASPSSLFESNFSAPLTFSSSSPRPALEDSAYWARNPWLHSQFMSLPSFDRRDFLEYVSSQGPNGEHVFQSMLLQSLFKAQALSWHLLITMVPTFLALESLLAQCQELLRMKPGPQKLSALRSFVERFVSTPSVSLVQYLYQHPLPRFPSLSYPQPFSQWDLFDDETFFFSSHIEDHSSPRTISPQWLQHWVSRRIACEELFAISQKANALVLWTCCNMQSSPLAFQALWRTLFAACDVSIRNSVKTSDILKKRAIKCLLRAIHASLIQQSSQNAILMPPLFLEALQLYAQWHGLSSFQYLSHLLLPSDPPSPPSPSAPHPHTLIEAVLHSSWCEPSQALELFSLCVPKISPLALSPLLAPSLWLQACSDPSHPFWPLFFQNLHQDSADLIQNLNLTSPAPIAFILSSWCAQHHQHLDALCSQASLRYNRVLKRKESDALSLTGSFLVSLMKSFPHHPDLQDFLQGDLFWDLLARTSQRMLFESILEVSMPDLPWLDAFLQYFKNTHQQNRLTPYLSAVMHFPTLSVSQKEHILRLIIEIQDESLLSSALALYRHSLPGTLLQSFLWDLHNKSEEAALYGVFFKNCCCTAYLPIPRDQGAITLAAKMRSDPKLDRYSQDHPLWQRFFHLYPQHSPNGLAQDLIQTPMVILGLWDSVTRQVQDKVPPCEGSLRLIEEFLEIAPLEKLRSLYIAHLLPYTLKNPVALAQFVISKIFFLYHIETDPQGFIAWTTPIYQGVSASHSPLGLVLTSPHIEDSVKQTFTAKCLLFGQLHTHLNQYYPLELGSLVPERQEICDGNGRKREKKLQL